MSSNPSIHPEPHSECKARHLRAIPRHPSIQPQTNVPLDESFLLKFDRLLIEHEPQINTFRALFQNLYDYYTQGKDTYWRNNNDRIAEPLPASQGKFWEYQEEYEKWTHPDFRIKPTPTPESEPLRSQTPDVDTPNVTPMELQALIDNM